MFELRQLLIFFYHDIVLVNILIILQYAVMIPRFLPQILFISLIIDTENKINDM